MSSHPISRRKLIQGSLLAGVGAFSLASRANQSQVYTKISNIAPHEPDFVYEVQRSESEWRELLGEADYPILREGETEEPKSSPHWSETRQGDYRCKGCDLLVYTSKNKIVLDKGWVFFTHGEADSVLMGIDSSADYGDKVFKELIEAHCRRCGSHLGHILYIEDRILSCINGASLVFKANADRAKSVLKNIVKKQIGR